MFEGTRYEVLDIVDAAGERVRRQALPRHADPRRIDRRHRAGRRGDLPAGRRRARGRRPRHRLHRGPARAGRRAGAVSSRAAPAARRRAAGARAVDVRGALSLVGHAATVPRADGARPRRALRSATASALALPRRGRDRRAARGWLDASAPAAARGRRRARGLPRRGADVARRGRVRRTAVHAVRRRAARPSARRVLRGDVRVHDHRRDASLTDIDAPAEVAPVLAPVHAVARRDGDHRARARGAAAGCASADASCSSREMPGPEVEPLAGRIRDTARRLWLLYIALTAVLVLILACYRLARASTTGWTLFQAVAHAFADLADRAASRPTHARWRASRRHPQWAIAVSMVDRRHELRAALPRARAPRPATRCRGTRSSASTSACSRSARSSSSPRSGRRASRAERPRCATAFSRRCRSMTTTGFANADYALWPTLAADDARRA